MPRRYATRAYSRRTRSGYTSTRPRVVRRYRAPVRRVRRNPRRGYPPRFRGRYSR